MAIGPLIGVGASLLGTVLGNKADKAKNKRAAEELALQKLLANNQIDISKYIQQISKDVLAKGSNFEDPYGGKTYYDEATKTWKSTLGEVPRALQEASDAEELARLTTDQGIRRDALLSGEQGRSRAASQADAAIDDLSNFKRGIGRVDPADIGSRLRADRMGAINAGFDDAERAAGTLQTRTGSSAVGDALKRIALDRVRAQASIGSPEVEGLELAEGINQGRQGTLANLYSMFSDRGSRMPDVNFTPTPYAGIADAKTADAAKFDLGKFETAMGGSGTAAAGIGSAAAGLRAGYASSEANRVHAPTAKMIGAFGNVADDLANNIMKIFGR